MEEYDGATLPLGPRQRAVLQALEGGCTMEAAAGYANIGRATLFRWQAADETFRDAIQKAQDYAEAQAVSAVRAAMPKEWTAAAWWLERRRPEKYGRRVAVELSVKDTAARLAAELGVDESEVVAEAEALLARAQGD